MNVSRCNSIDAPLPLVVRASGGECWELPGEARRQILQGKQTESRIALAHTKVAAGGPPLQLHTREDELFFVERGQFRFQAGSETYEVGPGDVIYGPRLVPHTFAYHSDEGGELFIWTLPAGLDRFLPELAARFETSPVALQEALSLSRQYGLSFDQNNFANVIRTVVDSPNKNMGSISPPKVVRAWEGERLRVYNEEARILLTSEDTENRFCLCEMETQPLCGPPVHVCPDEDEIFLIRDGRYEFCLEDARVHVGTGDTVFVPRGAAHNYRVVSAEPGRLLLLSSPGGFDDFLRAIAAACENTPASPQLLNELAAQHGNRIFSMEP